jgi:hypothetical protein
LGEHTQVEASFDNIKTVWRYNKDSIFTVLELVRKAGYKILYAGSSSKFGDSGLMLVNENHYGDEFGIGSMESFLIIEIAQLFGGEIEMLLERKGNRMTAHVNSDKTRTLGWNLKKNLADYL